MPYIQTDRNRDWSATQYADVAETLGLEIRVLLTSVQRLGASRAYDAASSDSYAAGLARAVYELSRSAAGFAIRAQVEAAKEIGAYTAIMDGGQ